MSTLSGIAPSINLLTTDLPSPQGLQVGLNPKPLRSRPPAPYPAATDEFGSQTVLEDVANNPKLFTLIVDVRV